MAKETIKLIEEGYRKGIIVKAVLVDRSGAIPHFHYANSDKGLVSYDIAEKLKHGAEGYLVFIPSP